MLMFQSFRDLRMKGIDFTIEKRLNMEEHIENVGQVGEFIDRTITAAVDIITLYKDLAIRDIVGSEFVTKIDNLAEKHLHSSTSG